jgi:type I restriction enzyme S subunit
MSVKQLPTIRWPEDWRNVPLWAMFDRVKDVGHPNEVMLSVYREYGVIKKSSRDDNTNQTAENRSIYQLIDEGWLIVNRMKAWQGSLGISPLRGIVSGHYICFRPRHGEDPRFLNRLLRSDVYTLEYARMSRGVRPNQIEIDNDELHGLRIILPPLEEQRRIADFLDRETARIDALIAAKQRMNELLEERFAGRTSALLFRPKEYLPVRLKFISGPPTSGNRDHGSFTYTPDGIPCLRGVDLSKDYVDLSRVLRISAEDSQRHANTKLQVGDLVIVRSGATAGRSALVTRDLDGSNCVDLVVVRKSPALEPRYLAYVVRSQEIQDKVLHESSGALQPHFNAVDAGEILVPMRSLDDQKRVVATLDDLAWSRERMVEALDRQIDLLKERRQALITAAVTGQFDIAEAA